MSSNSQLTAFHRDVGQLRHILSFDGLDTEAGRLKIPYTSLLSHLGRKIVPCLMQAPPVAAQSSVGEVVQAIASFVESHYAIIQDRDLAGLKNLRHLLVVKQRVARAEDLPALSALISKVEKAIVSRSVLSCLPSDLLQLVLTYCRNDAFLALRQSSAYFYHRLPWQYSPLVYNSSRGHDMSLEQFASLVSRFVADKKPDYAATCVTSFLQIASHEAQQQFWSHLLRKSMPAITGELLPKVAERITVLPLDLNRLKIDEVHALLPHCQKLTALKVDDVDLPEDRAENLQQLFNCTNLTSLDLTNIRRLDFDKFSEIEKLKKLKRLTISLNAAATPVSVDLFFTFKRFLASENLAKLSELQELHLIHVGTVIPQYEKFGSFPPLKKLELSNVYLSQGLRDAMQSLQLDALTIRGTFRNSDLDALFAQAGLKRLCLTTNVSIIAIARRLDRLVNLEHFSYERMNLHDPLPLDLVEILQNGPKLKSLRVKQWTDAAVDVSDELSAQFSMHEHLESLSLNLPVVLAQLPRHPVSAKVLNVLLQKPKLRSLMLHTYRSDVPASIILTKSVSSCALQTFSVSSPAFDNHDLVAAVSQMPNVRRLQLRLALSDQVVESLTKLTKLNTLVLDTTRAPESILTNRTLLALSTLTSLRDLRIVTTGRTGRFSQNALQRVQQNPSITHFRWINTNIAESHSPNAIELIVVDMALLDETLLDEG